MRNSKLMWAGILCMIAIPFMAGCEGLETKRPQTWEPGWYGITNRWNNGYEDVKGEVGHRLYVGGPQGRCLPSSSWTQSNEIISGTLPPGLSLGSDTNISGIPTERGHWIVKLRMYNIKCEGLYYDKSEFTQELRFHITGSGKVVQ